MSPTSDFAKVSSARPSAWKLPSVDAVPEEADGRAARHPDEVRDLDLRLLDGFLKALALLRMETRRLVDDEPGGIVAVFPLVALQRGTRQIEGIECR
jgi:hypothetical protein